MLRFYLLFVFTLLLTNCRTSSVNVQIWDKGYPHSSLELKSNEAKEKEFNKFAIAKGGVGFGVEGLVQTQADMNSDKYYTLGSFSSVIAKVSPEAESRFQDLRVARPYYNIAIGMFFASLFLYPNGKINAALRNGIFTLGLGGMLGIGMWQSGIFDDIKNDYHQGLNRHIYGGPEAHQSSTAKKGYGIQLSYQFN